MCSEKCPSPAALDNHSLEQREAAAQSKQMASHARPPHCDRRQEEGEDQCQSKLTLNSCWCLTDSLTNCHLSSLFMSLSLSLSFTLSLFLLAPLLDIYFSVFLLIHVCLTCLPIRVAFAFINVTGSRYFFLSLSCLFLTPRAKSIVIHSSQSLSMIYCNVIISHSFS